MKNIKSYVAVALHAANVQPGQLVMIRGGVAHREIALAIEHGARELGCEVIVDLLDPLREAQLVEFGSPMSIQTHLDHLRPMFSRVIREQGVLIQLAGPEFPTLRSELQLKFPENYQRLMAAENASREIYKDLIVNHGQWIILPVPTDGWAKQVYGEIPEARANLEDAILRMMFAEDEDTAKCIERRNALDEQLHALRRELNALTIKEIHIEGPGTDFTIGLSDRAFWLGGTKATSWGMPFNANCPSFEVFTTPDNTTASGQISMTMPFLCGGVIVRDLVLTFEEGKVVKSSASEGLEAFQKWIATDEGASRIGEFALVDRNSPIGLEGVVFYLTLLDENASGHFALGSSYSNGLVGGPAMSKQELIAIHANQSAIHTDMMWNGPGVNVTATTYSGETVVLMEDGCWTSQFAA